MSGWCNQRVMICYKTTHYLVDQLASTGKVGHRYSEEHHPRHTESYGMQGGAQIRRKGQRELGKKDVTENTHCRNYGFARAEMSNTAQRSYNSLFVNLYSLGHSKNVANLNDETDTWLMARDCGLVHCEYRCFGAARCLHLQNRSRIRNRLTPWKGLGQMCGWGKRRPGPGPGHRDP